MNRDTNRRIAKVQPRGVVRSFLESSRGTSPSRSLTPLTKIHHAAFDAHLIGIDPSNFRIHVSVVTATESGGWAASLCAALAPEARSLIAGPSSAGREIEEEK